MAASGASLLRVLAYPEAILRARAAAIPPADFAGLAPLVADMLRAVVSHQGLGLGAPQVGKSIRLFVMREPTAWNEAEARRQSATLRRALAQRPARFVAVANPVILSRSPEEAVGVESCLSLPDYPCLVRRARGIEVQYDDLTSAEEGGRTVTTALSGLPAVVFQHELDHLDGLLICDRRVTNLGLHTEAEAMNEAADEFERGLRKYYAVR